MRPATVLERVRAVRPMVGRLGLGSVSTGSPSALGKHGWPQALIWTQFLMWLVLFVCGGATCAKRETISELQPPVVFTNQPGLEDITQHINRSLALTRLESNTLTVSGPDLPTKLRGNMKWVRPHNFMLEAYLGTKLMGTALAAGSNSEMFWMQTQSPPTLYYASHADFENQAGPRHILPVSPLWLREALGVVELDPELVHQDPIARADGKLEIRSLIPSPRGSYRRHIVLDANTGVIEQTLLYNHLGKLVAVAQQSEHEYYAAIDYSLPHRVDIQLQPDEGPIISFTVEIGFYLINESGEVTADEFQLPDARGLSTVNLAQANGLAGSLQAVPPTYQASPSAGAAVPAATGPSNAGYPTIGSPANAYPGTSPPGVPAPGSVPQANPFSRPAKAYSAQAENPLSSYRGVR